MKRSEECQVRKRDGRREWLRASKLARSIGLAMAAARGEEFGAEPLDPDGEDWRAPELGAAILTALRTELGSARSVTTSALADAVQQVLVATGFPVAAEEYVRAGAEQRRRRAVLQRAMPSVEHGLPLVQNLVKAAISEWGNVAARYDRPSLADDQVDPPPKSRWV